MKAVVSLDEFRKNLSDIVSRVMYSDQTVLVQKHNKSGVIIISEKEYDSLRDPRKRFSSRKDWNVYFDFAQKIGKRIPKNRQKEFEKILAEEIKAVRQFKDKSVV